MSEQQVKPDPGAMPSQYVNMAFVTCHGDQGIVRVTLQEAIQGGTLSLGAYTMTIATAEAFAEQIKMAIAMSREKMAKRKEGAN
jgi:hypothetical protein